MKLSSRQLQAFMTTAKTLNFSKAAQQLYITQSALSQRIQKLEEHLECSLFQRGSGSIKLTTVGEKLLRYCTAQVALEQEFLIHTVLSDTHQLVGNIRIAGFSTVMESLILPELGVLMQEHPHLSIELHSMEIKELLPALESGLVDFIITSCEIQRAMIHYELLGYEHNVLVISSTHICPEDVFLDHDNEDTLTSNFWQHQKTPLTSWRTFYLDNIHIIIAGVKQGFGRAIVPYHLVKNDSALSILDEFAPLKTPVYLAGYKGYSQTKLQKALWNSLKNISAHLRHK